LPLTIWSGGQTGVDRAAWDAAIRLHLPQFGWVPKGKIAEDGTIPTRYRCRETKGTDYVERTERNLMDADATLILSFGPMGAGTQLTLELSRKHQRPHLWVDLDSMGMDEALEKGLQFLRERKPGTLNVAGPRGSYREDVYGRAKEYLTELFESYGVK